VFPDARPPWLEAIIGAVVGLTGQLLIALGVQVAAGWEGPLVTILAPALVGAIAGFALKGGWGSIGLALGVLAALLLGPAIAAGLAAPTTVDAIVVLTAAVLGYAVGYGAAHQSAAPDFMVRPPAPADLARMENDVRGQLRGIDPLAPGAFERATVLLRTVNEHATSYGPWSGPRPANEPLGPPSGLMELQAELVETARVAAIAAGARRVTITSSGTGGGIDVQAVFGDPISPDEPLRRPVLDVD
jgi:hypothetical protein